MSYVDEGQRSRCGVAAGRSQKGIFRGALKAHDAQKSPAGEVRTLVPGRFYPQGAVTMCLSNVYEGSKKPENLLIEEAGFVTCTPSGVSVSTLFGETKRFDGYAIAEISLLEHYLILVKKEELRG